MEQRRCHKSQDSVVVMNHQPAFLISKTLIKGNDKEHNIIGTLLEKDEKHHSMRLDGECIAEQEFIRDQ